MRKSILIVVGGGRPQGNTAQLVDAFARSAEAADHMVEIVSLVKNEVKGCLGCNACRYGKPCVQRDAFNSLVPKVKSADCIVFASPLCLGGFRDRGMLLAGGCGDTNGPPKINGTDHLERAFSFGQMLYL